MKLIFNYTFLPSPREVIPFKGKNIPKDLPKHIRSSL